MKTHLFVFTLLVHLGQEAALNSSDPKTLYVGALFELSNHWYEKYVNFFVTIVEHVFEEVDNRTDILPGYSLKLITKDTEGKNGLAARRMVELMTEGPPIVGILGPTLSQELTVVGQIVPFYDVVQLSYIATTSSTVDRAKFSTLFRVNQVLDNLNPLRISMMQYFNWSRLSYIATTSSTVDRAKFSTLFRVNQVLDNLNPLRISMMQYFNWSRVGTLFYQDDASASEMSMFHELLKDNNMTLVTSAVVSDNIDFKDAISRFLHFDVRIIMGSFRRTKAPQIFCEAYKQGLYGINHIWILSGPIVFGDWIEADVSEFGCSADQLIEATNGHFELDYDIVDSLNTMTVSNLTPLEVTTILENKINGTGYKLSMNYAMVYDTAWTMALGLNNSLNYLNDSGLQQYTNNPYYLNGILKGIQDVNFAGVSGPVYFDETGGRVGVNFIKQTINKISKKVAIFNHNTRNLSWFVTAESLWPGGVIPQDRFTYHRVLAPPHVPSIVIIMLANVICSVVALGFLAFNIYYRKNSNIKLSSPTINNIIIAGSILIFSCVFITTMDYGHMLPQSADNHICMVRVWIMCLGFTSLFGALFSKTWRVHILFRDHKIKKTIIKDYHLFGIIMFLWAFDCIILTSWTAMHSLEKENIVVNTKDGHNLSNILSEVYTFCHHPYEGYWFVSIYIFKGLLLIFGVFLAWETRHVTITVLNDSKHIGFCIYNVVIVCVFGVPLTHVLPTQQRTLNFILLSSLVMFCTMMCLCILFIPKIRSRNKVNDKFLVPPTVAAASTTSATYQNTQRYTSRMNTVEVSQISKDKEVSDEYSHDIEGLKKENNRLRMEIAKESMAMARLKKDILQITGNVHFNKVGDKYVVFGSRQEGLQIDSNTYDQQV